MTPSTGIGLAERLHISEREWAILAKLLARLAPGITVWAFGSRATGRNLKRFSDLDLAVPGTLPAAVRAELCDELDEALIDFKVDLIELDLVTPDFRERIEKDFVVLQSGH